MVRHKQNEEQNVVEFEKAIVPFVFKFVGKVMTKNITCLSLNDNFVWQWC